MIHPFAIPFKDLYTREGLLRVQQSFEGFLKERSLLALYKALPDLKDPEYGEALMVLAPLLEEFLANLFRLEAQLETLRLREAHLAPLFQCRRDFVQRRVAQKYRNKPCTNLKGALVKKHLSSFMNKAFEGDELLFATHVLEWMKDAEVTPALESAEAYAAWALFTPDGQAAHQGGTLFKLPKKLDFQHLIQRGLRRKREGFDLTDAPITDAHAHMQAKYCIGCHKQTKDTCRTGFENRENPLGEKLEGCPLKQRISEMNLLKAQGYVLGALAVITMDNPMVAATGRRICNACAKACIFQKQTPVDIPSVETHILETILDLPWGFEIYGLLTRWNPLKSIMLAPETGKKILVVGMGPAGFSVAHHLLNDGHTVVGIEGLKIEPLPTALQSFEPIQYIKDHFDPLSTRSLAGFGGVAEYGITARWNKNFLLVIHLLLARRKTFKLFGSTRLESTITTKTAFDMGFEHVAVCVGAGKPHIPALKNNLAPGVRHASDFLMALQLTGAAREESLSILNIRLPVVVIGAGLTAVDAATEALAYYPKQVACFKKNFIKQNANKNPGDLSIEKEFLDHANALEMAAKNKADPHTLLDQWGGASILYRKSLQQAPAYRKNHEELESALAEGVHFLDKVTPKGFQLDDTGHVMAIECTGRIIPAKTVLLATGTNPNTVIAHENPNFFEPDGLFLKTSDPRISFLGDVHPAYTGSVVHALASAKETAPQITKRLKAQSKGSTLDSEAFFGVLEDQLQATLVAKESLEESLELVVKAPMAAAHLKPGQFFRLQAYDHQSPIPQDGVAVMGVLEDATHIRFYLRKGSRGAALATHLTVGETLALMGPTGAPLPLPEDLTAQNIVLVGEAYQTPLLHYLGTSLEKKGARVFYNMHPKDSIGFILVIGPLTTLNKIFPKGIPHHNTKILRLTTSPMQCMMKGICARCIQRRKDPKTGKEQFVFACQSQFYTEYSSMSESSSVGGGG